MSKPDNHDQIHRFIFDDASIRGEIVSLNSTYQKACEHQALPRTVKNLLGEFLAAASLLGEVLKFKGTITIQARGDGPVPLIMADISHDKDLRGIAKVSESCSHKLLPEMSLKQLLGDGVLTLTMDPDQGQRYQGIVELSGENLALCLNNYFSQSEQLPTQLWLFADTDNAGGILLQSLPKEAAQTESLEEFNTAAQLASTTNAEELFELDHATMLQRLFSDEFTVRLYEGKTVEFTCQCSHERCANTLVSLGREEINAILTEQGIIEINCEFCGTCYSFDDEQLEILFTDHEKGDPGSQRTLH